RPVIGVPVNAAMDGLDALLSIAQMPKGVPVACVGIGRGDNAAILAAQIIALSDDAVAQKLSEHKAKMSNA
ncbi:MAG: AIR carboxylase family protein, partial [Methanosarcinales archaeon]|nr:AIR carboxylase family protein [Methanosarcinales archaeon]